MTQKEFASWLDDFRQDGHMIVDDIQVKPNETPAAKKRQGEPLDSSRKKKSKLHEAIIEMKDISDALITEVKLTNQPKDAGVWQQRSGHKIFLCNKSNAEAKYPKDFLVCGFGKGAFKLVKEDVVPTGALSFSS